MCYAHSMRIDFHSHFPSTDSIVCTAKPENAVLNGNPGARPLMSFQGLLPENWSEEKQAELFRILAADGNIHLGEVGLDKRHIDKITMQQQADILRTQLSFAIKHNRNISLHCVRATGLMLEILDDADKNGRKDGHTFRPFSIIWHGFTGSAETAAQLARKSVILSIGPRFKGIIADIYRANPYTVPETDYEGTDAQEHSRILEEQYRRFREELNLSPEELDRHCTQILQKLNTAH